MLDPNTRHKHAADGDALALDDDDGGANSPLDDDPDVDAFLREVAAAPAIDPSGTLVGVTLGRYRVQSLLGHGAMGVVYLAEDESLRRRVAVKVLRAQSLEARVRIQREARCAAAISHPGVARVYEVGEVDDRVYIVIEYIDGVSLRCLMGDGIPAERAQRIFDRILDALAAAHAVGVVHRDVKPENIMVTAGDQVKVLDFGLATWIATEWSAEALPHTLTQSIEGRIAGTPGYMAPEQALGLRVDARADVFSLGVIAYELFVGRRPFTGETAMAVLVSALHDEVAMPADHPLRTLIARCLAKDSAQRFVNAGEVLRALRAGTSMSMRSPSPSRGRNDDPAPTRATSEGARYRKAKGVVAALVATSAVATAGWRYEHHAAAPPPPTLAFADMIWVPGGAFDYGRTREELDRECTALGANCLRRPLDWEQPRQRAHVSSFYMDIYEVTNEQFASFLGSLGSEGEVVRDDTSPQRRFVRYRATRQNLIELYETSGVIDGQGFAARPGYAKKPVMWVTWDGARLYCERLGRRLPREIEWEYAARGVDNRRFPWGNDEPSCDGVVFGRELGFQCDRLPREPEDVGNAPHDVTPLGLHDLGGNVAEWVEDAFTVPYHPPCGDCVDSTTRAAPGDANDLRVVRGGSWSSVLFVRATARFKWKQTVGANDTGFRCAMSAHAKNLPR